MCCTMQSFRHYWCPLFFAKLHVCKNEHDYVQRGEESNGVRHLPDVRRRHWGLLDSHEDNWDCYDRRPFNALPWMDVTRISPRKSKSPYYCSLIDADNIAVKINAS